MKLNLLLTNYYSMWYSIGLSVYMGETDCRGNHLAKPLVLKITDKILAELKEEKETGLFGSIMYRFSKNFREKKERQLIRSAYHEALKLVGLSDFRPYFMMDHEWSLVVRASSSEEAKRKFIEKREDLYEYCHIACSPNKNLIIEENLLFD